ncbi:MAG: M10 family metallopeptidase C-terminal domain-containing protein [Hyphomicrobiales bacterium]
MRSSTVSVEHALVVAIDGTCDLTMSFGLTQSESLTIGQGEDSNGHVTVGPGRLESGDFLIGADGIGNFTIENGGTVVMTKNDGAFLIGANAGGEGYVTVTGETGPSGKSTLDLSRTGNPGAQPFLAVGASGKGVLNVEDHALLRTQTAYIGLHQGSIGTVNLDEAGWVAFEIKVGDGGTGYFNASTNAAVASQDSVIGNSATGHGEVVLDHAFWTMDGSLAVGRDGGTGSLVIKNGGAVTFGMANDFLAIGIGNGSGTVEVTGVGSELSVNKQGNFITLGTSGPGELTVADHALVKTPELLLGDQAVVTVSGGGAIVIGQASTIAGAIHIGGGGRLDGSGGAITGNLVNDGRVDGTIVFEGDTKNSVVNNGVMTGVIHLGDGDDIFDGSQGDTSGTIWGDAGDDVLIGSNGSDILYGDSGRDTLTGRAGKDTMSGGEDSDRFVFNSIRDSVKGSKRDQILDFQPGIDLIDLQTIDAKKGSGNQAFKWIGKNGFHDKKGELHYVHKGDGCIVQGDVNGDGKADFEIFVKIGSLAKGDFLL